MNKMMVEPAAPQPLRWQSVLVVSASQSVVFSITNLLRDLGLSSVSCASLASASRPEVHRGRKNIFAAIIVDIDSFGGIGGSFDQLRNIRECDSRLPVIVISSEVLRDDMTQERLPICDVTLRKAICVERLQTAILAAQTNCAVWRKQVSCRAIVRPSLHWLPMAEPVAVALAG